MTKKTKFPHYPLGWMVLLKPKALEEVTKGGIIITQETLAAEANACVLCEVVAKGDQAYTRPEHGGDWVEVGDWVLIAKFAGHKYIINDEEYRLIDDDKILMKTEDPDAISVLMPTKKF